MIVKSLNFNIKNECESHRLQRVLFSKGYGWGVYRDQAYRKLNDGMICLNDMGELSYMSRFNSAYAESNLSDVEEYITGHYNTKPVARDATKLESLMLVGVLRTYLDLSEDEGVKVHRILVDTKDELKLDVEIMRFCNSTGNVTSKRKEITL